MKTLAIDCSATAASAALFDGEKMLGEYFMNVKTTHSETLMPMVTHLLKMVKTPFEEIDRFAISAGPGSFTGVRIGISAVKGMAFPKNADCVSVSTLSAMAYNMLGNDCIVCSVMDARCSQVYSALFSVRKNNVERLSDDTAQPISELFDEICRISKLTEHKNRSIIVVGDGTDLFLDYCGGRLNDIFAAPPHLKYSTAAGVGLASILSSEAALLKPENLNPVYLRLPQAERELKSKTEVSNGK